VPTLKELYDWYYCPGETIRSIGFYVNPYKQWENANHRHIFAFDACCNLFVGQFSVYHHHMNKICDLKDRREYGMLYPKNTGLKLNYSGDRDNSRSITDFSPVIEFEFFETKNIIYLNRRLKKLSQRLYDYGMPKDTVIISKAIDLWEPSIASMLRDGIWERPDQTWLQANL